MAMVENRRLSIRDVRPYVLGEKVTLGKIWPPINSRRVPVVLPKNLLQEDDIKVET
jgi:hypothetical protein